MWITTKSIVKEIRKSQDNLAAKLEVLTLAQEDNHSRILKQISRLQEGIEHSETYLLELEEKQNQKNMEIFDCLKNVTDLLLKLEGAMTETANEITRQITGRIDTVEGKNSASIVALRENCDRIIKQIRNVEEKISSNTNDARKALIGELDKIKAILRDVSLSSEKQEKSIAENAETMNVAMQEVMRNLSSLDEGNRLIIAKFLLEDLGDGDGSDYFCK